MSRGELRRARSRPGQLLKVEGVSPAVLVKERHVGCVEPVAQKLPVYHVRPWTDSREKERLVTQSLVPLLSRWAN